MFSKGDSTHSFSLLTVRTFLIVGSEEYELLVPEHNNYHQVEAKCSCCHPKKPSLAAVTT